MITERDKNRFYASKAWRTLSKYKLGVCSWCECDECKGNGIKKIATEVHHIVDLQVDWSKRLDYTNLMSVSKECHSRITLTNEHKKADKTDKVVERLKKVVGIQ